MSVAVADILVVIPLYNHAGTVRDVVARVLALHPHVLVVDDGSTDAGTTVLDGLDVRVIRQEQNRGKGVALKTAFYEAQKLGFSHIITLDADGQHYPENLPEFIAAIAAHPYGIIVGKRDFEQVMIPGSSRFGRKFSNFWLRVQTGISLGDSQSGYRAYPVNIVLGLPLYEKHYSFEVEVLVRAAWAGVKLHDVDIEVFYPSAEERISHFRGFMDNLRLTLLNTKLTLRSVAPWPHRKLVAGGEVEAKITIFHPLRSIRALLTENTTPSQLAVAGALGIFLGALPLLALHTIVILLFSGFLRLNKVATIGASQLCMPPLLPGLCIEVGHYLRYGRFLTEISVNTLGYQAIDRLYEWLLGSLVVGPLLALLVAAFIYQVAVIFSRNPRGEDCVGE